MKPKADLSALFAGDSEMARRMRELDWTRTALGTPGRWPASLTSTLSLCLNARFPMAIYWGAEGFLFYNDSWQPILGEKHPWAMGRPAREVWPEIWDVIAPLMARVLNTGEATRHEDGLLPMQRFGYTEECYFDYTFNPIRGASGKIEGILNVVQETTYRVLNERRARLLRELAARCASAKTENDARDSAMAAIATDNADIPFALLYRVDPERREARLLQATGVPDGSPARPAMIDLAETGANIGWPLAATLRSGTLTVNDLPARFGTLPGGLWPETTTQAILLPLSAAAEEAVSEVLIAGINPRHTLDGDYRHFFDHIAGYLSTALTNARAYSMEKRRAEALAEIDRAKTVFFGNISHEFRTPLTLILGPAEEMISGAHGELNEVQRAHMATLRDNALRLQKLVNTLLDFARVEARRVEAHYEPVDLAVVTRELASAFCSAVHRAGLLFIVNCPSLDEPIYVDRDMWEKIVLNLLSNALKFTLKGVIEVSLRPIDGAVALTVRDTGVGIPEAELPHMFERFHRIQAAGARSQEGSGIGLALVQELVRLHGGTVRAESVAGQGSTFTVVLPKGSEHLPKDRLAASRGLSSTALGAAPFVEEALRWLGDDDQRQTPRLVTADASDAAVSLPKTAERIVVADDNSDMRNYLRRLLELRWQVETVGTGSKALAAARDLPPPDLIIADVMMPELNGFELVRQLRADARTKTIPVILLSARAGEEAYVEGMNAGADDYIVKPFGARELMARVKARLEIARVRSQTEQRISNILESITDGFQVIDDQWRLTYLNSEAKRTLAEYGIDAERSLGRNLWELFPGIAESELAQQLRRAMTERVPVTFENFYRPWGRWYSHRVYPLSEGGLANYYQDITVRKVAEQRLMDSEQRFRKMADSSPIMIWVTDEEGRMSFLNRTFLEYFGVAADGAAAFDWAGMIHPDDLDAYVAGFRTALQKRRTFHHRVRLQRFDGAWRWFESRGNPLLAASGEVTGYVGSSSDITDMIESEETLKEADRRKDEFLANMSHEIRSPMTGIMGYADILLMKLQDPDNIECVRTIKESGKYLLEIIDDILDLSKIEAGKLKLNKEPVSLTGLLSDIYALMEIRARERKLPLILKYDGPVPETIETDRTRLRQILVNLVSNAIKFTEQGSVQIVIRYLQDADLVQIDVIDTGIGISPAQQKRLFQPFTQADSSSTREFGGTGLGLAITRRLVEMLDGSISYDSEVGKGSTFHVVVPTGPHSGATVHPIGIGSAQAPETSQSLDCRVLVVDDRPEIRYLISHFIREAGGQAVGAADGDAAIQIIRDSRESGEAFDALLMDIQMPGIDGYQVTRQLRAEGFDKPIIALTASAMKGEREKCMEAGCDDYMTKPIDRRKLVDMLARFCHASP